MVRIDAGSCNVLAPAPIVRVDRVTRLLLAAITVLLALLVIELWSARPPMIPGASAQVPDSGKQRNVQIDEQRRTNELLARIAATLEKGTLTVRMERGAEKPAREGGR